MRVVRDLMTILTLPHGGLSNSDIRHFVRKLPGVVDSGLGQAQIVEDVFKHMRERENLDILIV